MKLLESIYRVLDTECTGLELPRDVVIEVAFQDIVGDGYRLLAYQSLVNPEGVTITPGASAAHHLVDQDVADAPERAGVFAKLTAGAAVFVGHNVVYDRGMLRMEDDGKVWLDTLRMAKHCLPGQESYQLQVLRYALKLTVNLPKDTAAHRAAADVAVTEALFLHLLPLAIEKWGDVTPEGLATNCSAPVLLSHIRFGKHAGMVYKDVDYSYLKWLVQSGAGSEDDQFTAKEIMKGYRR